MVQVTLYRKDGTSSMVPHILLLELGVPFTSVPLRTTEAGYEGLNGKPSTAEFLKINLKGQVPTLCVDGAVVTEMPAVLTRIAALAPERQLTGANDAEKARVLEWMAFISGSLNAQGFAVLWRPYRFAPDAPKEVLNLVKAGGKATILRCFGQVEEWIEGPQYAVGGHLTVVDMLLHSFYRWGKMIRVDMKTYPRWTQLARETEKLESVRTAMSEERNPLLFKAESSL